MTKAYDRFLTVLFCLFLGGLLVWHVLLPDRAKSETENRTLAQLPEFSWDALVDGSYTTAVEKYFADQFPLRDGWTGMKARAEQAIGKTLFNGVYLCDDTLISKVDRPAADQVDKNLSYISRFTDKAGVPVYLGLDLLRQRSGGTSCPRARRAGTRPSFWSRQPSWACLRSTFTAH